MHMKECYYFSQHNIWRMVFNATKFENYVVTSHVEIIVSHVLLVFVMNTWKELWLRMVDYRLHFMHHPSKIIEIIISYIYEWHFHESYSAWTSWPTAHFGDLSLEAYLLDMHKMDGVTHSMTHTVPHRWKGHPEWTGIQMGRPPKL